MLIPGSAISPILILFFMSLKLLDLKLNGYTFSVIWDFMSVTSNPTVSTLSEEKAID